MAGSVELGGGGKSGGAGADDGDFPAGADGGGFGDNPAFLPAFSDDGAFEVFDGDRRGIDAEDARAFARGRADAAGEFGEIVRLVEAFQGFPPEAAIDEIVPLGDKVVDGATGSHAVKEGA